MQTPNMANPPTPKCCSLRDLERLRLPLQFPAYAPAGVLCYGSVALCYTTEKAAQNALVWARQVAPSPAPTLVMETYNWRSVAALLGSLQDNGSLWLALDKEPDSAGNFAEAIPIEQAIAYVSWVANQVRCPMEFLPWSKAG